MASIGHVAVGLAVARAAAAVDGRADAAAARTTAPRLGIVFACFSVLALLPDADVIAFALKIPYAAPFGHRGASHSLCAALLATVLLWLVGLRRAHPAWTLAAFIALTSHGLLDTLTDGGLGAALLWPLSDARIFAPLRPIPVAPIGFGLLSWRGLYCVLVETLGFAPLFAYALWPRRPRALAMLVVACAVTALACDRPLQKLASSSPAFLGDASGLYVVAPGPFNAGSTPRLVAVVEVNDRLIAGFTGGAASASQEFINQVIQTTSDGHRHAVQRVDGVPLSALQPALALRFPDLASAPLSFDFDATIGLDALHVVSTVVPGPTSAELCKRLAPPGTTSCGVVSFTSDIPKQCDFDPRVSGVYSTSVKLLGTSGACPNGWDGDRQWAVIVANGANASAVIALHDGVPEMALALTFSAPFISFALAEPLSEEWTQSGAFSASLQIDQSDTLFQADFTRALGNGCQQHYSASGSRATGTKAGLACMPMDQCAGSEFSSCPTVPSGLIGQYEIASWLVTPAAPCPIALCRLRIDLSQACDASSSIFQKGCPLGQTLALDGGPAGTCYRAACSPATACDALRPSIPDPPPCAPGTSAAFYSVSGCGYLTCAPPIP